jgi:leader peptidase (prepilin peptidase)/N-methyltransferase
MSDASLVLMTSDPAVVAWFALVGACIGSFLNVVVYRLPGGKSIVHPGSYCPQCRHPVRGYDNIPVVSWLVLKGRCRDCRAPISPRYPLVEATVATVFVLIAALEILPGAKNLPGHSGQITLAEAWAIGAYHLCLLCTLLCVTLIEYDGNHVPWRLTVMIVAVGLIAPALMSVLKPVTVTGALSTITPGGLGVALASGLAGGVAGALLGVLAWPVAVRPGVKFVGRHGDPSMHSTILVATFLGWQAIMVIVSVSVLLHAIVVSAGYVVGKKRHLPWSASLAITTVVYLLTWGIFAREWPFLVTDAGWTTFTGACLGCWGVSMLVGMVYFRTVGQESSSWMRN